MSGLWKGRPKGALPRDMSKPAPVLEDYLTSDDPLPIVTNAQVIDRASQVKSWPMYLNGPDPSNPPASPNGIGDCTIAAIAHAFASFTAYSGQVPGGVLFPASSILTAYSAVSGYDQKTGANDNGAQLADVCRYMVSTGMVDNDGKTHKLAAWAEIEDFTDVALLKRVLNAFGAVYLAIDCPESAETQFPGPWTYVPSSQSLGGHAIVEVVNSHGAGLMDDETVVTWGALVKMNEAFADHKIVEAIAIVSADDVNVTSGTNPQGLDLQQMIADCQSKYLV